MPSLSANALLDNEVVCYDEVAEMADRGSLNNVIYLDFCKAFDDLTQLPSLHTETWIWRVDMDVADKELAGGTQRVFINGGLSSGGPVKSGVTRNFLLEQVLFNIFIKDRQWDEVPPQKVCRWHRAEQCTGHSRRKGCHPERPAQFWEAGPWESHKVEQVQGLFFFIRS